MGVLAVLCMVVGVVGTLGMVVLMLAGTPNATPATLARIRWLVGATALVGVAALAGSVWAFARGRLGLSSAIGIVPLGFVVILGIVLVTMEW